MIPDPDILATTQEVPWEPRPAETGRAFMAFAAYRDLGPLRTLKRAGALFYEGSPTAELTEPRARQVRYWSAHHDWRARADAWDLHLDRISRVEAEEAAKEMRRQWARLAAAMRGPIDETLSAMAAAKTQLSPGQLTDWMRVGKDVEAWAREVPSEVAEVILSGSGAAHDDLLTEMYDEVQVMRARKAAGS